MSHYQDLFTKSLNEGDFPKIRSMLRSHNFDIHEIYNGLTYLNKLVTYKYSIPDNIWILFEEIVNSYNGYGQTPLIHAIHHNPVRVSSLLNIPGLDVNMRDSKNKNALEHVASSHLSQEEKINLIIMLLDSGAEIETLPDQTSLFRDLIDQGMFKAAYLVYLRAGYSLNSIVETHPEYMTAGDIIEINQDFQDYMSLLKAQPFLKIKNVELRIDISSTLECFDYFSLETFKLRDLKSELIFITPSENICMRREDFMKWITDVENWKYPCLSSEPYYDDSKPLVKFLHYVVSQKQVNEIMNDSARLYYISDVDIKINQTIDHQYVRGLNPSAIGANRCQEDTDVRVYNFERFSYK